jgi:beta-lactamase class A
VASNRARRRRRLTRAERLRLFLPGRSIKLQLLAIAVAVLVALQGQSFASAREGVATYLIQPGDTLLDIATRTGVSLEKLIGLNSIQNPDIIVAGKTLQLDGAASDQVAAGSSARYVVKNGDTLWDISVANSISFDELIKLNNLEDADALSIGQQLRLPERKRAAPAATPTPAPKPKPASKLQQRVQAEAQRVAPNARVGVSALNLVTNERIALRADESFPSASVMKLPILVELERQIARGRLAWSDKLRAQAGAMMAVSDNIAANEVGDVVGMQAVNDTMASLGLKGTRFVNTFTGARSQANPGQNQTTPANMTRLLELIATDQIVNANVSADLRTFLARNTDRSKLVRLLPPEAKVAHKSGWYEGVANDVGIVTINGKQARWVISVFSQTVPDAETGNQLVAAISRAVYDAWAGE